MAAQRNVGSCTGSCLATGFLGRRLRPDGSAVSVPTFRSDRARSSVGDCPVCRTREGTGGGGAGPQVSDWHSESPAAPGWQRFCRSESLFISLMYIKKSQKNTFVSETNDKNSKTPGDISKSRGVLETWGHHSETFVLIRGLQAFPPRGSRVFRAQPQVCTFGKL